MSNINKIKLEIKGPNIINTIKQIHKLKIDLINIEYINKNKINIIIYEKDYKKIKKQKINHKIINTYGINKLKIILKNNKQIFIYLLITYLIFRILTNTIFNIKILTENKQTRDLIKKELNNYNIKKYHFKKTKDELDKITKEILNKHKDKLEWISIENIGTNYIIKTERRIIPKINKNNRPRDIVSKKNAIIKQIYNIKGQTIKEENTYVKKGETIISSNINLNDEIKEKVRARGKVYGEVWYKVITKVPLTNKKKIKQKPTYKIIFLKKRKKYIIKNDIIPLYLTKEEKIKTKTTILTYDEAINKAKKISKEKLQKSLNKGDYIISQKHLKTKLNYSTIEIEMFFTTHENITSYKET